MQYNNSGVDHNVYMLATIQSIVQMFATDN